MAVTYFLRPENQDYYRDVALFANQVLAKVDEHAGEMLTSYTSFLAETKVEKLRTRQEYAVELLLLGTLWQSYGQRALALPDNARASLVFLANLRHRKPRLKSIADFFRGILGTIFLAHNDFGGAPTSPNIGDFKALLNWLEATGEYSQEVARLKPWHGFLASLPQPAACTNLLTAIRLSNWLESYGEKLLGKYTVNVESFLLDATKRYRWREDLVYCTRGRVEYHLNMVGAQILSLAYREDFLLTKKKAVLVPGCMRHLQATCRALKKGSYLRCQQCNLQCHVNQLTNLGRESGFDVLIILHESSLFSSGGEKPVASDVGIVGVACVGSLLAGGLKAKTYDVPAQCVLLDYAGCQKHWHPDGVPTAINTEELFRVLGISKRDSNSIS